MLNKNILKVLVLLATLIVGMSAVFSAVVVEDYKMKVANLDIENDDSKMKVASIESKNKNPKMTVTSSGIKNGKIAPKYGMYGAVKDKNGVPRMSIPLTIKNAPKKTKFYAVYMYDNTVPWVHWLAVNYKSNSFTEDASRKKAKSMNQGRNSFGTIGYGGPTPPDKTHTYTLKVFALDSKVNLGNGYSLSQFNNAIKSKTLATATIRGNYIR